MIAVMAFESCLLRTVFFTKHGAPPAPPVLICLRLGCRPPRSGRSVCGSSRIALHDWVRADAKAQARTCPTPGAALTSLSWWSKCARASAWIPRWNLCWPTWPATSSTMSPASVVPWPATAAEARWSSGTSGCTWRRTGSCGCLTRQPVPASPRCRRPRPEHPMLGGSTSTDAAWP